MGYAEAWRNGYISEKEFTSFVENLFTHTPETAEESVQTSVKDQAEVSVQTDTIPMQPTVERPVEEEQVEEVEQMEEEVESRVEEEVEEEDESAETPWQSKVTCGKHTYTLAHKDYQAKTGRALATFRKTMGSGRYILQDGNPIYYVRDIQAARASLDTPNSFPKAVALRIRPGGCPEYLSRSATGVETTRPIMWGLVRWCVSTGRIDTV